MKETLQAKLKRIKLALLDLQQRYGDTGGTISFDHADDAHLAFLTFCTQLYHVRDYLVEEGVTKEDFDSFIMNSGHFHLCAKIATLDKHQKADANVWKAKNDVSGSNRNITIDLPPPGHPTSFMVTRPRFEYTVDGIKIDALVAAEGAWEEFQNFIRQHNSGIK